MRFGAFFEPEKTGTGEAEKRGSDLVVVSCIPQHVAHFPKNALKDMKTQRLDWLPLSTYSGRISIH